MIRVRENLKKKSMLTTAGVALKGISRKQLVVGLLFVWLPLLAFAMQPVNNSILADVVAQEGIQLSLATYLNANMDGTPITTGTGYTNCGNTDFGSGGFSSTNCRLAIQALDGMPTAEGGNIANEHDQWWLVSENFYEVINFPAVNIDSEKTPVSSSPYADPSRFLDSHGNVLLASPNNMPVMKLSYPEPFYFGLNQALAIQYGATGYMKNENPPALALRIANLNGGAAEINAEGYVYVYGF